MTELTLSVIICTKDRPAALDNCLETVFAQTRLPQEIILVDDGSLDGDAYRRRIAAHAIQAQYLRKAQPGLAASRNLGIQAASGDILLFLDDDVLLEPGYIAALLAVFEDDPAGQVGGVTGALKFAYRPGVQAFLRLFLLDGTTPGALLPSGYGVLVRQGEIKAPMDVQWLAGCNMAYRREVFTRFAFDQRLGAYGWSEDRDFSVRVGRVYRLAATPDARLVHLKDPAGRIARRRFGFMETNYLHRFCAKNMPRTLTYRLAMAWAMTGIVLRNLILGLVSSDRQAYWQAVRGNLEGLWAIRSGKDWTP